MTQFDCDEEIRRSGRATWPNMSVSAQKGIACSRYFSRFAIAVARFTG